MPCSLLGDQTHLVIGLLHKMSCFHERCQELVPIGIQTFFFQVEYNRTDLGLVPPREIFKVQMLVNNIF